jgi:hypothetical protein
MSLLMSDVIHGKQKEIRRAYWKYIDGIMSSETESELETGKRGNTMKQFWTFIKHKRSDGRQILPLKSEGLLHSEPVEKANIMSDVIHGHPSFFGVVCIGTLRLGNDHLT